VTRQKTPVESSAPTSPAARAAAALEAGVPPHLVEATRRAAAGPLPVRRPPSGPGLRLAAEPELAELYAGLLAPDEPVELLREDRGFAEVLGVGGPCVVRREHLTGP
jgi:hypothetical protein